MTGDMSGPRARALAACERALIALPWRCSLPVLLVTGLPRSGTTLVSQYLAQRLRLAWFTEAAGEEPAAAVLWSLYQQRGGRPYLSDFRSAYGRSRGAAAPREAGSFWGRFFGFEAWVGARALPPGSARVLRRSIAALQLLSGARPFLNKNVKHLSRLGALADVLPSAHFVVVDRDAADVALSLLRARRALLADPREWWSIRPPTADHWRDLPPVEQVALQVSGLRRALEADLARMAPGRFTRIRYARFCSEPDGLVGRLRSRLEGLATSGPAVASFAVSRNEPRDAEELELVKRVREAEASARRPGPR